MANKDDAAQISADRRSFGSLGELREESTQLEDDFATIKSSRERYHATHIRIENFKYPEHVRVAVNFEIHFDGQLVRRLLNEPIMERTIGEYGGRVGIWNLINLFEKHGIRVTIFTPGRICELYPEALKEAAKRGHEIANHMWEHRVPSEPELEKDHIRKAVAAVEKLCGKRPVGSRSRHRLSFLKEEGYKYVSRELDFVDELPHYLVEEGTGTCMLQFPWHVALDDAMYYRFGWGESEIAGQRLADPQKVYEIWHLAFKQAYKLGTHLVICIHNFQSGRSLRVAMLDRLLFEMKRYPGVWFPTYEEFATYITDRFPPPVATEP